MASLLGILNGQTNKFIQIIKLQFMQYLLQDLIKLPLSDRLNIIESAISTVISEDAALRDIIDRIEAKLLSDTSQ